MKKMIVLLFAMLQISCSFAKNQAEIEELEVKFSADMIITLLPSNLYIITSITPETDRTLANNIFKNLFLQLSMLKQLEVMSDSKYSAINQIIKDPLPAKRNQYCLINKFLLSYVEKYPDNINELNKSTLTWINDNQKILLDDLKVHPLPVHLENKCMDYQFNL